MKSANHEIERIPRNDLPELEHQSQPSSETDADHGSILSARFVEASAIAHAHAERAAAIIKLYDRGAGDNEAENEDALKTTIDSLQRLMKETPRDPFDFILKSGQPIDASRKLLERLKSEQKVIWSQHSIQEQNIRWEIEKRTKIIREAKGFGRISAIFDKRKLERERQSAYQQIRQLREEENKKQRFIGILTSLERPIQDRREECFLSAIKNETQAIRETYEKLYDEIIKDGTITREIREAYIQEVIEPRMSKICDDHPMLTAQRDEFYAVLQAAIENRHVPEAQRPPSWERIVHLLRTTHDYGGFYGLREYCEPLLRGEDEQIIKALLAKRALAELYPIETLAEPLMSRGHQMIPRFNEAYHQSIEPGASLWHHDKNTFGGHILSELKEMSIKGEFLPHGSSFPNMDLWNALRSSETANETFGEAIREQNEAYYQHTMNRSLSDTEGFDIDRLPYFPTPDAIRNLVLLAAADYKNYRSIHAYSALKKLREQKDCQHILGEAEKIYPGLRSARSDLESWDFVEAQRSHPTLREAAAKFSLAIVESNPSDPRLNNLALEALPNNFLLDCLEKRGMVQNSQTTILKESEAFIREAVKEFDWLQEHHGSSVPFVDRWAFQEALRKVLLEFLRPAKEVQRQSQTKSIHQLVTLAQALLKQRPRKKTDYHGISYFCSESVVNKIIDPSMTDENEEIFLTAYVDIPALVTDHALREEFCKQFKGRETVLFFRDMDIAYRQNYEVGKENFTEIIKLVGAGTLTHERALELSTSGPDILGHHLFRFARDHPTVFLATDQGCDFFRKAVHIYNETELHEIVVPVEQNRLSRELALEFPKQASGLMDKKMAGIRSFIFANAQTLIEDVSDLRFLNRLAGDYGQKSDPIIRGYQECLTASVISRADKALVLEFTKQFRVLAPATIKGYIDAKTAGHEKVYVAQLQAVAERMTGSGAISVEERGKPYYKDLLRHVYANNSSQWTTFEKNESCDDRSGDLADFKIRKRYEIDLLSQSEIRIKLGEQADPTVIEGVKKPILAVAERMNALGHDKEKILTDLQMEINSAIEELTKIEAFPGLEMNNVTSLEEKLFLLLVDSLYGSKSLDPTHLKRLVMTYEFAMFEDISDYIAGTSDRVARASNQDYALLCEVGAFYSDRIKEVNRRLVEAAWKNPVITTLMPGYFQKIAEEGSASQRQAKINRLNIEKLGASENFIKQLTKILEKRKGKQYRPEEVREILRRYEDLAKGFQEKTSASANPQTRAFYGQLRSQRERTFEAFETITGETIDPASVHLGEINLQEAQSMEFDAEHGKYDEEQFAAYTVQRSIDLFEEEKTAIEGELGKYESLSGRQREVLLGFISKNGESAHARMVGGICVSGDNPAKSKEKNMWDMPNYFQLVFQEPDTLQCQGLVLLHHFSENGEKILAASMNPSSTYIYSVDEAALFSGIMNALVDFATENHFDKIVLSKNKAIRTNRTGGTFEHTMDARITSVGKELTFDPPKQFSFSPQYLLNEMDVIWERPTSSSPA